MEYLKDRTSPLYSSVSTYSLLANLLNRFLPSNTIFLQTTLKFTLIVTNHPIFTLNHVSLLSITGSPITIYYLTPIILMNFVPPNSLLTTTFPQMYLGHTLTPPSNTSTYLGIHINYKLTFDKHISTLKASTFQHLFNINKIRPYITTSTALTITQTLILSRLHYCIPILISSHNKYFTTIDRLTNRPLRLFYRLKKTNYTTSITDLRTRLDWPSAKKIAQLKLISILHSSLLTKQPDYLYRLIFLHTAPRHLRSSNYTVLTEPSYRRNLESLPPSLKTINTLKKHSNIN